MNHSFILEDNKSVDDHDAFIYQDESQVIQAVQRNSFISESCAPTNNCTNYPFQKSKSKERFSCLVTNAEMENFKLNRIPAATLKRNKWALNLYREWVTILTFHNCNVSIVNNAEANRIDGGA